MHPEQATKHKTGEGLFGDIANKAKTFDRKHKDLINQIIERVRVVAKSGINQSVSKLMKKLINISNQLKVSALSAMS